MIRFTAQEARQTTENAKKILLKDTVPEYISKILERIIDFSKKGRDSGVVLYPWDHDDDDVMEKLVMLKLAELGYKTTLEENVRGIFIEW